MIMSTFLQGRRGPATYVIPMVAGLALMLSACGSGDGGQSPPVAPGPAGVSHTTQAEAAGLQLVSSDDGDADLLGTALAAAWLPGADMSTQASAEGSMCLSGSVRASDVSAEGQKILASGTTQSYGSQIAELAEAGLADDAQAYGGAALRAKLDGCVLAAAGQKAPASQTPAKAPDIAAMPAPKSGPGSTKSLLDQSSSGSGSLGAGIDAVLGSYAKDPAQREVFTASNRCLTQTIENAGLSDEALTMLGEGPGLGKAPSGAAFSSTAIAGVLGSDDREVWKSAHLMDSLDDCLVEGQRTVVEKKKAEESKAAQG